MGDIKLAAFKQAKKDQKGKGKGRGRNKDKGEPDFGGKLTYIQDGKPYHVQAEVLRKIYWRFQSRGRVIEIAMPKDGGKKVEQAEKST